MNVEINEEPTGDGVKFTVAGHIDSVCAYKLQVKLDEALKSRKHNIIVNMSQVEYMCSIGLRILLKAYKDAIEAGSKLGIEQPSENVKKVLVLTSSTDMILI